MRTLIFFVICVASTRAAQHTWLDSVAPVITSAERKLYLSLQPEAQGKFEEEFWADKAIAKEEYFRRLQYVDMKFGSSKVGSGASTDPGRVYLSIGAPARITRIPSSRIFVPLEIWYYDAVPGLHLNTELRLIFYLQRSIGLLRLYSPTLDTIRALLVPQAGTNAMFGPNDEITEAKIRTNLTTSTVEDEIVSASANVASGVKYSGNDQILGQITSPMVMLGRAPRADVRSKLVVSGPKPGLLLTASPYGGSQIDLGIEISVQHEIDLEVLEGPVTVYQNRLRLKFSKAELVRYVHRIDLLPGAYRLMITVDGATYPYAVEVPDQIALSEILRAEPGKDVSRRQTPFEFDGRQLEMNPEGRFAVMAVAKPDKVTWILRRGLQQVWKSTSDASQIAMIELPSAGLTPGTYRLEARSAEESRSMIYFISAQKDSSPEMQLVSFNANLAPALRYASIGHQWLLRGRLNEARESLQASLSRDATAEAHIELARADALEGRLDEARDRVRHVLATNPNSFEALSVFAYVETRFQDYAIAAELYRRALAIQDSPAVRLALAKLPQ